jgi:hypothetical protein
MSNIWTVVLSIGGGLALTLPSLASAQNMIVDGNLENHTSTVDCASNNTNAQFNAFYSDITSFGSSGGIDIYQSTGCAGSPPQSGATKLALAWNNAPSGDLDAMAFDLNAPIVSGVTYRISFYAEKMPFGTLQPFEIGISNSNTSFGTPVFSGTPAASGWTLLTGTFVAPSNATFLTARPQENIDTWIAVDNFQLMIDPDTPIETMSITALKDRFLPDH